jgi:hypothetical protein
MTLLPKSACNADRMPTLGSYKALQAEAVMVTTVAT